MNITVLATGSRGDVQPFLALAYALSKAGHEVSFISNAIFEPLVRPYRMNFRSISWDPIESLRTQPMLAGWKWYQFPAEARKAQQVTLKVYEQAQRESWLACQDCEHLVYSILSPWGFSIAEKLGIPAIPGALHPLTPTRDFPTQLLTYNLGGTLNLFSHWLAEQALWLIMRQPTNQFRKQILNLPPIYSTNILALLRKQESPILYNLSPTITPRPRDWPDYAHMQGYWFLPPSPGWQPSEDLEDFLHQEPPPIYIGFGSMVYRNPEMMEKMVVEALRKSGQRGVLASGWGGLQPEAKATKNIYFLEEAPHEWLFPQVKAVVHHGGAGTTAAILRAGVPALTIPYMQDQPYWARRLQQLGISPNPIPYKKLNVANLTERLMQISHDMTYQTRAKEINLQIRAEQGVECAVSIVEASFRKLGEGHPL
jgi:sterol 3beta-glucosyltransferase